MKFLKKTLCLLLAISLFAGLAITVAADGGALKITDPEIGATYWAVKILDYSVVTGVYSTKSSSNFYGVFEQYAMYSKTKLIKLTDNGDGTYDVEGTKDLIDSKNKAELISTIGNTVVAQAAELTKSDVDGVYAFNSGYPFHAATTSLNFITTGEGIPSGYYAILRKSYTGEYACVAVQQHISSTAAHTDITLNTKNEGMSVKKYGSLNANGPWEDKTVYASVGDTVYFKVIARLTNWSKDVYFKDTLPTGLELDRSTIKVQYMDTDLTSETDYHVGGQNNSLEIDFWSAYVSGITGGKEVVITYSAKVTSAGGDGMINKGVTNAAYLQPNSGTASNTDTVTVKTNQFQIKKYDATETSKMLKGAEFELKTGNTACYFVEDSENSGTYWLASSGTKGATKKLVTPESGIITIKGIAKDTSVTLTETKAPTGYNKMREDKTETVKLDNTLVIEVPNNEGAELPSTGGIGTTIFYILGSVLVLGAGVILVTRKRMANY